MPRTQDFNIRYAKEKDFPYILQMVNRVVAHLFPDQNPPPEKIKDLFDKGVENQDFTCIVLVDPEDIPRGYVFACVSELYFTYRKMGTCLSIWVDEEHRSHSLDMLRAFNKWGQYKNLDTLVIAEFSHLTPKGSEKVLSWFGFELKEKQYWKDL